MIIYPVLSRPTDGWKNSFFFWKVIFMKNKFLKSILFFIFSSIMKNELENTFRYLVIS
jgi:hypothetical protein